MTDRPTPTADDPSATTPAPKSTRRSGAEIRQLKGDRRTVESRAWDRWLTRAAELVGRFDQELLDDPFAYNETASVSLLAAAASMAGFLGLAEFSVTKGGSEDRRFSAKGRCDFWLAAETKNWAFEFKQIAPLRLTPAQLVKAQASAMTCARRLRASEADERVAGLIVSLFWLEGPTLDVARQNLRKFAGDRDFAWEIAGDLAEASDTFLFFDLVP